MKWLPGTRKRARSIAKNGGDRINPSSNIARTNNTTIAIGATINIGSDTITNIKPSINVVRTNVITNTIIPVVLRTSDFWIVSAIGLPTGSD